MNLPKDPTRSAACKSAVQAEFVLRVRKRVSQIINEPDASSKFERRYNPNMGMVFVSKFMPKRCWNILVFGQASKSGQRPVMETTEELERQASSAPE